MSIKFPRHIWDGSAPDCPWCGIELTWENGDDGGGIQPPYDGFWQCDECGETWGEDGPEDAEYADAAEQESDV